MRKLCSIALGIFLTALAFSAPLAQQSKQASVCHAIAKYQNQKPLVLKAGLRTASVEPHHVQISYKGHSTFRIESSDGVVVATDYAGSTFREGFPNIVTMNHAHETHYTDYPDPAIQHVLRGWGENGKAADHDLVVSDVYVRNIPTDIYSAGVLIEENGNSIFVIEVAGLCIGHLGHLHHPLTDQHIAEIGRLDIMFAPVDGFYTISQQGIIDIARRLRASILIPMHYFSGFSLNAFLEKMETTFPVVHLDEKKLTVSLNDLPSQPTIMVMPYDF